MSDQRNFQDQQIPPGLGEREWIEKHRSVTRIGLARAMQAYALGAMFVSVGEHWLRAADKAMEVLMPGDTDAVLEMRRALFRRSDEPLNDPESAARTNPDFKTVFKTPRTGQEEIL